MNTLRILTIALCVTWPVWLLAIAWFASGWLVAGLDVIFVAVIAYLMRLEDAREDKEDA